MAKRVSADDLRTMFESSLCLYNNKPVYINSISEHCIAHYVDLFTQREAEVKMDEETFLPPTMRLGYVNVLGSVIYVSRMTPRRYKVGLNRDNTVFATVPGIRYPQGEGATARKVSTLSCRELADAMYGKYPSFEEAKEQMKGGNRVAVAIDHQFAITDTGDVFYKTACVGRYKAKDKTVYDIAFKPGYEHLITLLDNNHEKSV